MKLANALHLFLLTLGLGICIYYYAALPAEIPVRFGIDGTPEGYAPRSTIFVIYGIWVATAALLAFVARNPQYNSSYAPGLKPAELEVYRAETAKLLPSLNALTGALMLFIIGQIIYAALGHDIPAAWFWAGLVGYLGPVLWLVVRSVRRAKVLAKA